MARFYSSISPFTNAAEGGPVFHPDSIISVPQRHVGIAQGRSAEHIMAIRVERGPAVGVALTAGTPPDVMAWTPRDHRPRVLVAQIDGLSPQEAVQTCAALFGSRATIDRKAYVFHDGSDPALLKAVIAELKKKDFKVLKPAGDADNYAINLDTGEPFRVMPTAPAYVPKLYTQRMIDACIAGNTYMSGPLEILFDLTTGKKAAEDFTLNHASGREPGQRLDYVQ